MDKVNSNFTSELSIMPNINSSESESLMSNQSCSNGHWPSKASDPKRVQGKKRNRSPDKESLSHSRNVSKVKAEDFSNDGEQVQGNNTQQQIQFQSPHIPLTSQQPPMPSMPPSFPSYGYGVPDPYSVDPNQRPYPMMAPYNMYTALNSQWSGNQMDGMNMPPNPMQAAPSLPVPSGMDMMPSTSAGINPYAAYMPLGGDMYGMLGNYLPYPVYPQERMEQEASSPPTPPPVVDYSEHEANLLTDKLKSEEHFKSAAHILITWLERGECNRKTCGSFYSMIQCTNSHVKRLLNEKAKLEEKLSDAKTKMQQKMTSISLCFNEIYRVFETIQSAPAILDSFTKTQRNKIETMREKTLDIIRTHSRELVEERVEDEMELSEGEEEEEKTTENVVDKAKAVNVTKEEIKKIREELEEARHRLQNATDRNAVIKREMDSNCNTYTKILQEVQEKALAKQAEVAELQKFKENFLANQSQIGNNVESREIGSSSVEESVCWKNLLGEI